MKKENFFKSEELDGLQVFPYKGHKNHAPEHPGITGFVRLAIGKGYTREDLLVTWGECRGIKKELQEQGGEEKFESQRFKDKFEGEMTLLRAVCCLFGHLNTADMELYYYDWLDAVRNA